MPELKTQEDHDFYVDRVLNVPKWLANQGYLDLIKDPERNAEALASIEIAVARGIDRWYQKLYARRRENIDYDYWLISLGTAEDHLIRGVAPGFQPRLWQGFLDALFSAMGASTWLQFYDCSTHLDRLWHEAVIRFYDHMFNIESLY